MKKGNKTAIKAVVIIALIALLGVQLAPLFASR